MLSPAGQEREDILRAQLDCMLATSDLIAAQYWVVSEDDFGLEWKGAALRERAKELSLEASHTLIFRSSGGRVSVYRLP
jgi:hypothetical protein